jgi:hypothetical protein
MDYEKLQVELKRVVELTEALPEPYRIRCFELLLNNFLFEQRVEKQGPLREKPPKREFDAGVDEQSKLPLTAQLRVFMTRNKITDEQLNTVCIYADNQVHFLKEPPAPTIAEGQIQWALLLTLKSAIEANSFSVDPEAVRSICQDKGFYDSANFSTIFKRESNKKLFKGLLEPQGEAQQLSLDGEAELASLLKSMAG